MKPIQKIFAMIAGLSAAMILTALAEEKSGDKKSAENQRPAQHNSGNVQHHTAQPNNVAHPGNEHAQTADNVTHARQTQADHTSNQSVTVHHSHVQHVNPQASQVAANESRGSQNRAQISSGRNVSNQSAGASYRSGGTGGNRQGYQSGNSGNGAQYSQTQVTPNNQYNSGNNYGGNWSAANTHSDWNHSGQHSWNNNNYMWYQGGWLLITTAFNPFYVTSGYSDNGYYNNGSLVSSVQSSLTTQGYYNGPIDGDLGPATRNAIASYQNDNNLNVTGHINGPLLQSLQIQQN